MKTLLDEAKKVLRIEAEAISNLVDKIDTNFLTALELLYECKGRVVVTGMGKSGIIGEKIAGTLASTGTLALFMHPAEGMHGDLGMVSKQDVLIALSNSGETEEINRLLPSIKRLGIKLIALTGNLNSTLANNSDVVLDVGVKEEACPLGLVPTASTTATLAMGDALAITLLKKKGFKEEDFALLHPGGTLGKKLLLEVKDVMHTGNAIPKVTEGTLMRNALFEMTSKRLGITTVVDEKDRLAGIITDGDLRRLMEKRKDEDIWDLKVEEIMTKNPRTISQKALCATAVAKMEEYTITSLLITNKQHKLIGIVHLHDLLKAGVV
ncbi:MAG: KpsF/GutQ family sugar-phosphate isomerase [bacterium]|nr:KpsF/GutQ family sugar-phosphate isomerase [bacterium]